MSHFKKEIKDEHEGHEHYEALARKFPSYRSSFEKMAEDEGRHIEILTKIDQKLDSEDVKMHKSKVRSQAQKALGGLY